MSYCRFAWDDSDVYVIGTRRGSQDGFECVGCQIEADLGGSWYFATTEQEMIDHLEYHRSEFDHVVPQYAIDRLEAERDGQPYTTFVEQTLNWPKLDDPQRQKVFDELRERAIKPPE